MKTRSSRFAAATAAVLAAMAAAVIFASRSAASQQPRPPAPGPHGPGPAEELHALAARSAQGDAAATFEFARRVELGIGTEPDPEEAAWWYEVAEEQGYELPDEVVERLFP